MPAKLHVHDEADHYEEELEQLARTPIHKDPHRWVWITGAAVMTVVVIGLVIAIVRLASSGKRRKFLGLF